LANLERIASFASRRSTTGKETQHFGAAENSLRSRALHAGLVSRALCRFASATTVASHERKGQGIGVGLRSSGLYTAFLSHSACRLKRHRYLDFADPKQLPDSAKTLQIGQALVPDGGSWTG